MAASVEPASVPLTLAARCRCGAISFLASVAAGSLERCHCARCRRASCSSFVPCVVASEAPVQLLTAAKRYADRCSAHGAVERLFCGRCCSSLGMLAIAEAATCFGAPAYHLALGCVEDSSVPSAVATRWQTDFCDSAIDERAAWWSARPERGLAERPPAAVRTLSGGCACGGCAFECQSGPEFQTQHCYCKLCRQLSGAASQTWVPVRRKGFTWLRRETLELVRTTGHGQRHMCSRCGGVLSIVYDSQPDCIWPAAGALDDHAYPAGAALHAALCRSIHICCSMMPPWYQLPDDGLPRLPYAG